MISLRFALLAGSLSILLIELNPTFAQDRSGRTISRSGGSIGRAAGYPEVTPGQASNSEARSDETDFSEPVLPPVPKTGELIQLGVCRCLCVSDNNENIETNDDGDGGLKTEEECNDFINYLTGQESDIDNLQDGVAISDRASLFDSFVEGLNREPDRDAQGRPICSGYTDTQVDAMILFDNLEAADPIDGHFAHCEWNEDVIVEAPAPEPNQTDESIQSRFGPISGRYGAGQSMSEAITSAEDDLSDPTDITIEQSRELSDGLEELDDELEPYITGGS